MSRRAARLLLLAASLLAVAGTLPVAHAHQGVSPAVFDDDCTLLRLAAAPPGAPAPPVPDVSAVAIGDGPPAEAPGAPPLRIAAAAAPRAPPALRLIPTLPSRR